MKIFVCWSGDRSYKLAGFLKTWLETVVNGLHVFVSSDIEKGRRWSEDIKKALSESRAGLVCLAWESCHSAWINYESGALANAVDSQDVRPGAPNISATANRLYPYLLDIEPSDLPEPLQQFQVTRSSKEETKAMVKSLAKLQEDDGSWIDRFQENWPTLANKLVDLKWLSIELAIPGFFKLFARNTFTEKFPSNPRTWLDRYFAARQTYLHLEEADRIVAVHCSNDIKDGFSRIRNYTKEYAMFAIPYLFDARTRENVTAALREVEDRRRGICESVEKLKIVASSSGSISE
jgi:TIR domain